MQDNMEKILEEVEPTLMNLKNGKVAGSDCNSGTVGICRKENIENLSIHLHKMSKTKIFNRQMEQC